MNNTKRKRLCAALVLSLLLVCVMGTTAFAAGSTDVGDVSWQTPTVQCYAVTFPSGVPGHS